jgi:iron complex transport system substrate-binding protein
VLLLVSALAPACGRPNAGDPAAAVQRTVTVVDAAGPVRVPQTADRIWALDEYAALQLLVLGVAPIGVGELRRDDAARAILAGAGIPLVKPSAPELVAAALPAVIVGTESPDNQALRPLLERIAPVVLPDFATTWEDQLGVLAAATGRSAEAVAVTARVKRAVDDLAARVAGTGLAGRRVSLLSGCGAGTFCAYDASTLAGTILTELGFSRPPAQVDADPDDSGVTFLSEEQLPAHGGDIVISYVGSVSAGASILGHPLLDTEGSRTADVDFGVWYTSTPLSAWWIVRDLESILLGDGATATTADAPRLWGELTGNP